MALTKLKYYTECSQSTGTNLNAVIIRSQTDQLSPASILFKMHIKKILIFKEFVLIIIFVYNLYGINELEKKIILQ